MVRDVGAILSYLMIFLLFITPVFYAPPTEGFLATLTTYNPLYYLISVPRDLLLFGTTGEGLGFMITSMIAPILFLICWIVFHLAGFRIAERI